MTLCEHACIHVCACGVQATARVMWLEAASLPLEMREVGDLVNAAKLTLALPSMKLSSVAHKTDTSRSSTASGGSAWHAVAVVDVSCSFWGVCPGHENEKAGHVLMWSLWEVAGVGVSRSVGVCIALCAQDLTVVVCCDGVCL